MTKPPTWNGWPLIPPPGKYFIQTADIDFTGRSSFTPIGDYSANAFKGSYDGRWHKISNIAINAPANDYVGLFAYIYNTTYFTVGIKNLTLENTNITGKYYVGAVAGFNAGTIENCHITGTSSVTGPDSAMVGGFAGMHSGTIQNCSNAAAVTVGNYTSAGPYVGGLAGNGNIGKFINCYNTGTITCGSGGASDVTRIGGIAGCVNTANSIQYCYSTGTIESPNTTKAGGIVGSAFTGNCVSNYYLDTSADYGIGMLDNGSSSDVCAEYKIDADMTMAATFDTGANAGTDWDFTDTWKLGGSYPVFITTPAVPAGLTGTAGKNQAALSWTAANRAGWYKIYQSTTSGSFTGAPIATTHMTSYTVTGLNNGTTYYFAVKACNSYEESALSAETSVIPVFQITDLAPTAGDTQVSFTFSAATEASSIKLYQSTDGTNYSEATTTETLTTASTSATVTGLTNSQQYYFKLGAMVGTNEIFSNVVTATPVPPPAANGYLSALSITGQTINETFDQDTLIYTAAVAATADSITLTATALDSLSIIKVNGISLPVGGGSTGIDLVYGINPIEIRVNPDGAADIQKTYTLTVTRTIPAEVTIQEASKVTDSSGLSNNPVWLGYYSVQEDAAIGFDLSSYTDAVQTATLKLFVEQVNVYGNAKFNLYGTDENDWGITTAKILPAAHDAAPLLSYSTNSAYGWMTFDVTDYVKTHISSGFVSFYLEGINQGSDIDVGINPDESSSNKPALELNGAAAAATLGVTVAPGTSDDSTKATIATSATGKFVVNITDASVGTVSSDDSAPAAGSNLVDGYTSGADITAGVAVDKYLQVYDVATDGKVAAFYEKKLTADDIKPGTLPTPTANLASGTTIKSGAGITLSSADGSTIYYTIGNDPANPTTASGSITGGDSINVTGNPGDMITIKAYAVKLYKYDSAIATFTYTIKAKKGLTVTGITAQNKTYDGGLEAVLTGTESLSGIDSGDDVTISGTPIAVFADKNIGTDKAVTVSGYTLSGADAIYYDLSQPIGLTADITAKAISATISIADKLYDGTTTAVITGAALSGTGTDDVALLTTGAAANFSDANVGNGKTVNVNGLTLTGTDAGNYILSNTTLTTTGNILNNGTAIAPTGTADGTTIKSGANVILTAEASTTIYYTMGTDPAVPASSSMSVASGGTITVTGNPGETILVKAYAAIMGKYDSTLSTFIYYIKAKQTLEVTGVTAQDRIYNGGIGAALSGTPTLSGTIDTGDVVEIAGTPTAAFADKNIGTDKAVTVSGYTLSGADAIYYDLLQPTGLTADITAKTISVATITITDKIYNGATDASISGVTFDGREGTDDITWAGGATATFVDANVGTGKIVNVSGLALTGADAGNYNLAGSTFTTTGNILYDGTATAPAATLDGTTIKSGASVTLTADTGATIYYTMGTDPADPTFESASVATGGTITVTGNPGEVIKIKAYAFVTGKNNSVTAIFTYNIKTKKDLDVTGLTAQNKTYNGGLDAALSGSAVLSGAIDTGDAVELSGTPTAIFASKNFGTGISVIVSGYTLSGADAIYYNLIQPTGLAADITAKTISIASISIADKPYDGSTTAAISGVTFNGRDGTDDLTLASGATATFVDATVGTGKTVNISGLTLTGADAGNYNLDSTTFTATGNIVNAGTVCTPVATPTGGSVLSGTKIYLACITEGASIHYTTDGTPASTGSPLYSEPITITRDMTINAMASKIGINDSAQMTEHFSIQTAGALPVTLNPGNGQIGLEWSSVADSVYYELYMNDGLIDSVTGSVYSYNATGLTNGTIYYFNVKALNNTNLIIAESGNLTAIPRTVPGLPAEVSATAENGSATVYFTAPMDNGGNSITGYIVTSNPDNLTATGAASPITITGLTNGTSYTFTVQAQNAAGNSAASAASSTVTPRGSSSGGDSNHDSNSNSPQNSNPNPVSIEVNGNTVNSPNCTTTEEEGQTVTTVIVDNNTVSQNLNQEGNGASIVVAVNNASDAVVTNLNGQTIEAMQNGQATLQIQTANVTYTVPAQQINIDQIASSLGVSSNEVTVNVTVSAPPDNTVQIVQDTANRNNYQLVIQPIQFEITCHSSSQTIAVTQFNSYVERTISIPEGVDPSRITTGVILNSDGTFSHVPTTIVVIGGKYYARINSLTNSTYSVIWNPRTFSDVETHWAKADINDMGSRLVIEGVGNGKFDPDRSITRAEFAAIIIKGLGLMRPGTGKNVFNDVNQEAWYYDAVSIARKNNLISGYEGGKFCPQQNITREEAMSIMTRAMKITKLNTDLSQDSIEQQLAEFSDSTSISNWAKCGAAACIQNGIVVGTNGKVSPAEPVSRGQVAAMMRRILQKSKLI